jgi:hypothetical protein
MRYVGKRYSKMQSRSHVKLLRFPLPHLDSCLKLQLLYNIYPACMKLVLTFCLIIFSLRTYPHIVITGKGSGSVIQNGMGSLKPGDTLAILAGRYEKGGSFSNLTRITIVNYKGIVLWQNGFSGKSDRSFHYRYRLEKGYIWFSFP